MENNVFLEMSYLNFKDFAMLSIFINVGSQQRSNAGHPKREEQLPLSLEGKSTAREPHIALPFSYILQNKFCPCECRSDITLINIFPCRHIPRGAVFANICTKKYTLYYFRSSFRMNGACGPFNGFMAKLKLLY